MPQNLITSFLAHRVPNFSQIYCFGLTKVLATRKILVLKKLLVTFSYIACNPDSHLAPVVLGMFCLNTVLAISILGGVWSVLPAYEVLTLN